MRLINLTKNRKHRLLTMLKGLMPEYNSIRIVKVKDLPVVVFKKQWWKFWTRYTVNLTDVCISEIPDRLDQLAQSKNLGQYRNFFSNIIFDIIDSKGNPHTQYSDIIDYLWIYYDKIYYAGEVRVEKIPIQLQFVESICLPFPFHIQTPSFSINSVVKEIPDYLKFKKIRNKVFVSKYTPETVLNEIRKLYFAIPEKIGNININLGFRTILS